MLTDYETFNNEVTEQVSLAPQKAASKVSSKPSPKPAATPTTTASKKRKHSEANLAPTDDQLTTDWQSYTNQGHSTTGTTTTSNPNNTNTTTPTPFIPPNLALTRSINHATTNPSNDIRLHTPYPAPPDILAASHKRYTHNIAAANAKAAAGASDSSNRIPFTIYEDDQIIRHMLDVAKDPSVPQTEERFAEVSRRLCGDGGSVFRSGTAIKNMWCRVGRGRSGYDERKGVRRNDTHVVNGWRAKPGNEKRRQVKRVKVDAREVVQRAAGEEAWFEL